MRGFKTYWPPISCWHRYQKNAGHDRLVVHQIVLLGEKANASDKLFRLKKSSCQNDSFTQFSIKFTRSSICWRKKIKTLERALSVSYDYDDGHKLLELTISIVKWSWNHFITLIRVIYYINPGSRNSENVFI